MWMYFDRHFDRADLERLFDGEFELPVDFLFGVANAAHQVEGGLNGPGEPLNNWVRLERSGKVETSGEAIRFWTEYEEQVERAALIGLNCFRMSIEWARVQPCVSARYSRVPDFDQEAIAKYADIVASVMRSGMEPMITLHHFTHPFWLGTDFWLDRQKLGAFKRYVKEIAERLNALLVNEHGQRPVKYWITINEPNALATVTYMTNVFPRRKFGPGKVTRAWNNMLEAHCIAYDELHEIYRGHGWASPMVTYNTIFLSPYYLDKFATDLLNARKNDVKRKDLMDYLSSGRRAWDLEISKCPRVSDDHWLTIKLEELLVKLVDMRFKLEHFDGAIDAIYSSREPRKLDYLAVDFYDPFPRHMVKLPSLNDIREKRINLNAEHWEWVLNPRAMYYFLKAETINGSGLGLFIVENGMCYKVHGGKVEIRRDGATRDKFLQSFLFEAMRAVADGIPLKAYIYWTMIDNYEWGSYEPRFGLYTVDRTHSPVMTRQVDAWGLDAAGAYSELISALRSGDRERMTEAFLKDY